MDKLQEYEINDIIDCLPYSDRNSWEQARLVAYTNVQINSKKKLSPSEVIQLPWDNSPTTEITNQDIERLKEKAQLISNNIYGKEL